MTRAISKIVAALVIALMTSFGLPSASAFDHIEEPTARIPSGQWVTTALPLGVSQKPGPVGAWGSNEFGEARVPDEAKDGVTAVAAGGFFSMALKRGKVITWGDIGRPPEVWSGVSAIAAGAFHALALRDGRVFAWGFNRYGQTRVPDAALANVSAISAGGDVSMALVDGRVIVWGTTSFGHNMVPEEAQSGVSAIATGDLHALAIRDGQVIAWGDNKFGQSAVPDEAKDGVTEIAAGWHHSLALKNGRVIAWGDNKRGQVSVPQEAKTGVTAIAAGEEFSLALKDGRVIAWGRGDDGQTAVPAWAQGKVSAISAGAYHVLAIAPGSNPGSAPSRGWKIQSSGPRSMWKAVGAFGNTGRITWTITDPNHLLDKFEVSFNTDSPVQASLEDYKAYSLTSTRSGVQKTGNGWTVSVDFRYRPVSRSDCFDAYWNGSQDSVELNVWDRYQREAGPKTATWSVTCNNW